MSDESREHVDELRREIARLTGRIYALEQMVERLAGRPIDDPFAEPSRAPFPAAPIAPVAPAWQPQAPFQAPPPVQAPAVQTPPRPLPQAYKPPRPPMDWAKVMEQLFAARTLAWAGGVATALGIVLLFVLAANRGWVTAPMRVGVGVFVSLVMLGVSIELDRRKWRADAILSAAGVGIAGLYASLWASASLYDFVSAVPASALAGLIAALAVGVAIRLKQEPLAIFGLSAAMLAPVLVSQDVTSYGVLYASVMLAASMILYVRFEWRWLVTAAWLVGFGETVALLIAERHDTGFGSPVVAVATVTILFVCLMFVVELMPDTRARISPLGWAAASSAFTLSLGGVFLFAATRHAAGHSLAGIALMGVMAAWALCAAVPLAVRRPHADLTDVLAAFSLTLVATATGLLAGGAALVSTWAAQSALLVVAAERIARRSRVRQLRITIAAGVYLVLATVSAVQIVVPTEAHLSDIGEGSTRGSIALISIVLAGVGYCFGTRWVGHRVQIAAWALPAVALGYLPMWALPAEWSVVALSGLASALFCFRRSPVMVSWMDGDAAAVIGWGWWLAGAAVTLKEAAPLDELTKPDWVGVGARHGLIGLAALTAAACVGAWSIRRPVRPAVEHALIVPVATFAYLIAEALHPPYAMWAWIGVSAALAAVVHLPEVRRRIGIEALIVSSGAMLVVGLVAAWARDSSLQAIADHGTTRGWPSIALAVGAGLIFASALLEPRHRSYVLWLPYLLSAQLATMLLPGQYPLVAMSGLAALAAVVTLTWPTPIDGRLTRAVIAEMAAIGGLAVSIIVLFGYETPKMLFVSSSTPASGLAAAIAATCALFLAAAAARGRDAEIRWSVDRVRIDTGLVYLAAAMALWTLAAAILGAEQIVARASLPSSVHDHFQQGHVAVSISWVLVGLGLVIVSLRGDRRGVRIGGIALLFVALGKLFLYDLAFLTAMARAVSFITTGSVLLVAALLLQRFAPQVKAALSDDQPDPA